MNDYITPESDYPIGHGDHYDLLAALSRELLAGETLRYGSVTASTVLIARSSGYPRVRRRTGLWRARW